MAAAPLLVQLCLVMLPHAQVPRACPVVQAKDHPAARTAKARLFAEMVATSYVLHCFPPGSNRPLLSFHRATPLTTACCLQVGSRLQASTRASSWAIHVAQRPKRAFSAVSACGGCEIAGRAPRPIWPCATWDPRQAPTAMAPEAPSERRAPVERAQRTVWSRVPNGGTNGGAKRKKRERSINSAPEIGAARLSCVSRKASFCWGHPPPDIPPT